MNTIPVIRDTNTLAAVAAVGQPQELTLGDLRAVAGGVAADAGESVDSPFRGWSDDRDSSPFRGW
jgi:hypothetical protein